MREHRDEENDSLPHGAGLDSIAAALYETPEVAALERIQDINSYHTEANVLEHTRNVQKSIVDALEFDYIADSGVRSRLVEHVNEKIGEHTRKDLLLLATILHDIGKAMTYTEKDDSTKPVMQQKENGDNTSPKHSEVGSKRSYEILTRMGFNDTDAGYVRDIIAGHMRCFNMYDALSKAKDPSKAFEKTRKTLGDSYIDMLVHTRADLTGSNKRDDYQAKELAFAGKTYRSDIKFIDYLIAESMSIQEISGGFLDIEQAQQLGTVYVEIEQNELREGLASAYKAQIQPKVDSGKIPADKLPGIIENKVNGVMSKIVFSSDVPDDYQNVRDNRPVKYSVT